MSITLCDSYICKGESPCAGRVTSYEGRVLSKYEINGYDDSDFAAIVYDDNTASLKTVIYGTTRGWTYHNNAVVDADAETIESARVILYVQYVLQLTAKAEKDNQEPIKGRTVRSLTTRGKNVGVIGVVRWIGVNEFRPRYRTTEYRLGLSVAGEEKLRYVDADRVAVVNPEPVDMVEVRRAAWDLANRGRYRDAW